MTEPTIDAVAIDAAITRLLDRLHTAEDEARTIKTQIRDMRARLAGGKPRARPGRRRRGAPPVAASALPLDERVADDPVQ